MSETTVHINNYYVDVEVNHFRPYTPARWGATPEDSDEGEEYELDFSVIRAVKCSITGDEALPTLEDIEEALVDRLH
jgi:hypothetical protein